MIFQDDGVDEAFEHALENIGLPRLYLGVIFIPFRIPWGVSIVPKMRYIGWGLSSDLSPYYLFTRMVLN